MTKRVFTSALVRGVLSPGIAIALGIALALPASAAGPIRTVVYRYSVESQGFAGSVSTGQGGAVSEDGSIGTAGSTGTVRADVVEATTDGGLVVDVTQTVDRALRPMQTVRCAVYGATQDVVCDQNLTITSAERVLLAYFGRFFYDPSRVGADGRFQIEPKVIPANMTIENDYTVKKKAGDDVTLDVHRLERTGAYQSTTDGSIVYNAARSVPESIVLDMRAVRSGSQSDMNVHLTMLSDSMAPAGGQNSH
ncbi:MAG TPA: hypothetical protein VFN49_08175 [Candidatus Aquilonibacter sp.]|nr:hypothetical protein [Candidatus Aquilonibacter sp.]